MLLPRPNARIQREFFNRGIQLGADGSVIRDGNRVYVINTLLEEKIQTVDYFHGCIGGLPICQIVWDDSDYAASDLISCDRGFVVRRITHLQTRMRRIMRLAYGKNMVRMGVLLSKCALRTTCSLKTICWRQFKCPSCQVNWWWHPVCGFFYVDSCEWERYMNPDDMECWWWHPKTARWFWERTGEPGAGLEEDEGGCEAE